MLNDHAIILSLMFLQKAWRAGDRMIKTQRLQSVDIMLFDLGFHSSGQSLKNLRKDFKRGDNGGVGGRTTQRRAVKARLKQLIAETEKFAIQVQPGKLL